MACGHDDSTINIVLVLLLLLLLYILRDIAIFIFGPFGLKLPIQAHFWEFWWDMTGFPLELGTGARVKKLECWGY